MAESFQQEIQHQHEYDDGRDKKNDLSHRCTSRCIAEEAMKAGRYMVADHFSFEDQGCHENHQEAYNIYSPFHNNGAYQPVGPYFLVF
jgi:hypothetical protein